jgi:hypothetical protein
MGGDKGAHGTRHVNGRCISADSVTRAVESTAGHPQKQLWGLFSCIKFTDVKFTGEFFQNFTNPSFPKVYTAEPAGAIKCLPDEVFAPI